MHDKSRQFIRHVFSKNRRNSTTNNIQFILSCWDAQENWQKERKKWSCRLLVQPLRPFKFSSTIMGGLQFNSTCKPQRPSPSTHSNLLVFFSNTIFTLLANQLHCADNSVFNSDISRGELELYHNFNNLNSSVDEVVQKGNTDILVDLIFLLVCENYSRINYGS